MRKTLLFLRNQQYEKQLLIYLNRQCYSFSFYLFYVWSIFNQKYRKYRFRLTVLPFFIFHFFLYHSCLFICLIKISGNPEEIPGPKRYSAQYLNICHVNLSSTAVHNFMKVALLKVTSPSMKWTPYTFPKHILILQFKLTMIICELLGYSSARADHPSNTKRRGILIYYKNFLSIKLIYDFMLNISWINIDKLKS